MFIAFHSFFQDQRRRLLGLVVVLALAGSVAAAHSVLAEDHMGGAAKVCLAVAETAALAVVVVGAASALAPARFTVAIPWAGATTTPPSPTVWTRSRAGPALLQVFRL